MHIIVMTNIAENIITKLGGDDAVSNLVGLHRTTVLRWRQRGLIPARYQGQLLNAGVERGIDISASDFFNTV